jgi:hypothetical protein
MTGDWLDPAAPLCLGDVAGRLPQCLRQLVTLKDHRVKARGAEGPELAITSPLRESKGATG